MAEIDWTIHFIGNGVFCHDCGKVDTGFPQYICNAHTHGMEKYGHPDFQVVIHMSTQNIGYVLNLLGLRVQAGECFHAGDLVSGVFEDCPVRLDAFEEMGRQVLRVVIPDGKNRFPEDPHCDYPYSFQKLPLEHLTKE